MAALTPARAATDVEEPPHRTGVDSIGYHEDMTALSQGIVCASAERASDAATDLRRVAESATPSPGQLVPAVKPEVSDPKLNNIVDNLYKGVSNPQRVGDGTTADAVRHERQTGEATHGRSHEQKAQDSLRGLENWLHRNPEAPASDRLTAQREAVNLRNALGEE